MIRPEAVLGVKAGDSGRLRVRWREALNWK
jgi:hypothetical protein